ncbi:hypothetical protein GJ496_003684 [Pomphorhynchus laevis]|nr:hypothetical protein GJ496_003684 [Pomphorhynchus laevis]
MNRQNSDLMPTIKGDNMRGLAIFISDIRNCKSREAELKRVNKELANIRSKFKGDRVLDGYSKKKYVCKLLFIFLLGNEVDFGYMEAVNLMTSNKYTEKQIGYLYISVMLKPSSDLLELIIQNIQADLNSLNPIFQNLALQCLSNICDKEIAEIFLNPVGKMLISRDSVDEMKQSAALTLLCLIKHYPHPLNVNTMSWIQRIPDLIHNYNMGIVTAGCSLIDYMCSLMPQAMTEIISPVISRIYRIISVGCNEFQDYTYYYVPAPWLCVKLMKLLQNYPLPDHPQDFVKLNETLDSILIKSQDTPKSKKIQHANAKNAVVFEAINLVIHYDCEPSALVRCANILGQFLQHRETNMRYLAIESLCALSTSEIAHVGVKSHMHTVIDSLKNERDLSVRQKALNLLYAMCDKNNSESVVSEMLEYINIASYQIKEELVLKIAILAEKYAVNYKWYIDIMLNLIRVAGDFVADEVWHRVIQVIVNQEDIQPYAAKLCFECLQFEPCYETMIKVSAYILGEYGNHISANLNSGPNDQLNALHSKFTSCSKSTRCLLLSTYVKFANHYPEIKSTVECIFESEENLRSDDVELQQRAIEYLNLCRNCSKEVMSTVMEIMPCFSDKVPNPLNRFKTAKHSISPSDIRNDVIKLTSLEEQKIKSHKDESTMPRPSKQESTAIQNFEMSTFIDFRRLTMHRAGLLYENKVIQIGFKESYRENIGQILVFLGNKSTFPLTNVQWILPDSNPTLPKLSWVNSISDTVSAGKQVQGKIRVECIGPFVELVSSHIDFYHSPSNEKIHLIVKLPILLNKFCEPALMDKSTFDQRWTGMNNPGQEAIRVDSIEQTDWSKEVLYEAVKTFGLSIIPGIDPNPNLICGAGIITMQKQFQAGILYKLNQNFDTQTSEQSGPRYQLTVRSAKVDIAQVICDLFHW